MAIPARRRSVDAERYPGLTALEGRADALGAQRRVVLTHSPNLHAKQAAGLDQTIAKAVRALAETAAVLQRGKGRRDRVGVHSEIGRILRPRWLDRIVQTTLTATRQPSCG